MELHQKHQITHLSPLQSTKFKPRSKPPANPSGGGAANKFVGVRQRPSGRWVAEIKDTTQKIRMWLGTFETAEAAALAYDEAACLLRGSNTRTNFSTRRPSGDSTAPESPVTTRIRKLLHHKKQAKEGDGEGSASPKQHKNGSFLHSADIATASGSGGTSPTRNRKQEMCNPWLPEEPFEAAFNRFELGDHGGGLQEMCSGGAAEEVGVFERMKVERQISASLYAMNGVRDYFDAMQEWSASSPLLDSAWDFPPFLYELDEFCL